MAYTEQTYPSPKMFQFSSSGARWDMQGEKSISQQLANVITSRVSERMSDVCIEPTKLLKQASRNRCRCMFPNQVQTVHSCTN